MEKATDTAKRACSFAYKLLSRLFACGCALILALITVLAIFFSGMFRFRSGQAYSERQEILSLFGYRDVLPVPDLVVIGCGFVAAISIFLVFFLIWKAWQKGQRPALRSLLLFTMAYALLVQLLWACALSTQVQNFPDTRMLAWAADAFNGGYFSTYCADEEYFNWYPYQSGTMLYFALVFKLFGSSNMVALQVINALANTGTIYCLFAIGGQFLGEPRQRLVLVALLFFCLPLFFSCALAYGNCLGLFLSFAAVTLQLKSYKAQGRHTVILLLIGAYLCIGIALVVKATSILFLIAMAISAVMHALRSRRLVPLMVAIILAICTNACSALPITIAENEAGAGFGDGMPRISWIAMGFLDEDDAGNPGWWSRSAIDAYIQADGDIHVQEKLAAESLQRSISGFIESPASGFSFVASKLITEWAEPTYQGLYYSSLCTTDEPIRQAFAPIVDRMLWGVGFELSFVFMDGYQIIVYAFALVCLIGLLRRKELAAAVEMLACIICIGFVVYLLWEGKSVYVLPFFLAMIPLAAYGLDATYEKMATKLKTRAYKQEARTQAD